jgi:hypothetical protein
MDMLCVLVVTLVLAPFKVKYLAGDHAVVDHVRNAFIGLAAYSDLVSQIY